MANTYRIVHSEPNRLDVEMQTASGWIVTDSTSSIQAAKEIIKQRKEKENWIVKVYDEAGDLAETRVPPNQSLLDA